MSLSILVTGGAGYVGTSLIPQLLSIGHKVTVFDRLLWGGDAVIPFFQNDRFDFIFGDVRDKDALRKACQGKDAIVHLASIVGYPACDMNPMLADQTNVGGAKNLAEVTSKNQHIVFASSGSNYGRVLKELCTEDHPLNPITRYSRNKTGAEILLMNETTCTALRPGTAFGLSPRLRLDLLVHQLTISALKTKNIVLYEADAVRPFLHIYDIGKALLHSVMNRSAMANEVYNLGANHMNYTKRDIAKKICAQTGAKIIDDQAGEDPDKRTYRVSYDKLEGTGFKATRTMDAGISEIVRVLPAIIINVPYSNANINA